MPGGGSRTRPPTLMETLERQRSSLPPGTVPTAPTAPRPTGYDPGREQMFASMLSSGSRPSGPMVSHLEGIGKLAQIISGSAGVHRQQGARQEEVRRERAREEEAQNTRTADLDMLARSMGMPPDVAQVVSRQPDMFSAGAGTIPQPEPQREAPPHMFAPDGSVAFVQDISHAEQLAEEGYTLEPPEQVEPVEPGRYVDDTGAGVWATPEQAMQDNLTPFDEFEARQRLRQAGRKTGQTAPTKMINGVLAQQNEDGSWSPAEMRGFPEEAPTLSTGERGAVRAVEQSVAALERQYQMIAGGHTNLDLQDRREMSQAFAGLVSSVITLENRGANFTQNEEKIIGDMLANDPTDIWRAATQSREDFLQSMRLTGEILRNKASTYGQDVDFSWEQQEPREDGAPSLGDLATDSLERIGSYIQELMPQGGGEEMVPMMFEGEAIEVPAADAQNYLDAGGSVMSDHADVVSGGGRQRLTPEEEEELAEWRDYQRNLGELDEPGATAQPRRRGRMARQYAAGGQSPRDLAPDIPDPLLQDRDLLEDYGFTDRDPFRPDRNFAFPEPRDPFDRSPGNPDQQPEPYLGGPGSVEEQNANARTTGGAVGGGLAFVLARRYGLPARMVAAAMGAYGGAELHQRLSWMAGMPHPDDEEDMPFPPQSRAPGRGGRGGVGTVSNRFTNASDDDVLRAAGL